MTRAFHQILGSCLVVSAAGAQTAIYTIEAPDSPTAPHAFGASVDGVGDMDGDGLAEFLYAAPFYDPGGAFGSGLVVVASGASGLPLHELVGATGAGIGTRAGRAGDVNGDGTPDFLATDSSWVTRLYSGADGSFYRELPTSGGVVLDAAGDVDADGFGDVLAGAGNAASVYSGASGAVIRSWVGGASFGSTVAGIGDVNGDGYDDVAVATPSYDLKRGKVELFSGMNGNLLHTFLGDGPNVRFGWTVASAGDADADGTPDIAAGAPFTQGSEQFGYVRVYAGAGGAAINTYVGGGLENLGVLLDGGGDLDLDGFDDVLAGAEAPYVRGYSPLSTTPLFEIDQPWGTDFATSLSGAGRVNHDAWPDFLVGDQFFGASFDGAVLVYSPVDLALSTDAHVMSLAAGGTQAMALDSGAALAGKLYLVLGSFSGTSPGIPGFGVVLPLNLDAYLLHTLAHPNQPPLAGSLGALDGAGDASASFTLPAGASPTLAGLTLHHAYAVLDPVLGVAAVSNAVPLSLVP